MRAAVALGSNLPSSYGDPSTNLLEALRRIGSLGELASVSSFYRTAPVGYLEQPDFFNAVALLHTSLPPLDLLQHLLAIEHDMGRQRSIDLPPKGPRVIDLDLLLYETEDGRSLILNKPTLVLPHPEMHRRGFVLEPLAEIAPQMGHPILQRSASQLLQCLNEA